MLILIQKYSSMLKHVFDACIAAVMLVSPMCFCGIFVLNVVKMTGVKWIDEKKLLNSNINHIITYAITQVLAKMLLEIVLPSDIQTGMLFIIVSLFIDVLYWDWAT